MICKYIKGFGASVLSLLINSKIKDRIYYEIKDRVIEERYDGMKTIARKQKVKIYGSDNTHEVRKLLIELLHQRVIYHKDKFLAPILHNELSTMEVKKNGKTEHAATAHDDQVFSYLWALYVWYYGENLMERFHMMKTEIKTDQDEDTTTFSMEERYDGFEHLPVETFEDSESDTSKIIEEAMAQINRTATMTQTQFDLKEKDVDDEALDKVLSTRDGRKAYADKYNVDEAYLESQRTIGSIDIGKQILQEFYGDSENKDTYNVGNLSDIFKHL